MPERRLLVHPTWWGPQAVDDLIPDARLRAAVLAEGHELPADFFDVATDPARAADLLV